ncbi:MAG: AAA family ATPase [Prevotellaceae bacterium]|nr:AAA family ATPase [Prevotellaceae bacterium]
MENSTLYLQRLRGLLQTEYNAQKEEFRIQTEKMGIRRKVRRGVCWYPVETTKAYYNSLNQYVVEITRQTTNDSDEAEEDKDIEYLFEYGRPVQFFSFNAQYLNEDITDKNNISYFSFTSIISFVDGNRMVATLPSPQAFLDLQASENLGVQLYFDETSFKTMFNALDEAIKAKNNRLADLKDIFAGQQKAKKLTFNPMQFPWLNRTQEAAVNEVLWAKDVAVVHGPPGTGKTTTLVEAIYETLHRETQVLVCAQSNMAVDWISEKLVDHGVPVLRIGNPTKVNDKMLSFTYERRFESHPDYPELWSIRHTIRQIRENGKRTESRHQKIARLQERASEIEMRISSQLFSEARVIACTLVGSANKLLVRQKFSTLFIDEAAQALEPACWIAIRRASRVVLAGDHQQLPPTIKCYEALRQGLGKTLMERIVENQPEAVSLLKVQYRMNDAIMRFSSDWFYNGQVESDPSVRHRSILDLEHPIQWIDGNEMLAQQADTSTSANGTHTLSVGDALTPSEDDEELDIDFKEEFIGENHGRINKAEAELVLCTLKDYINKIGKRHFLSERLDVGIISPYRVQTRYIRQQIYHRAEFRPFRHAITVSTVDGFQGQERDIILISLVRSNDSGQIGFLSDLRRMNVAMTRARMKLIIFGDKGTMRHHAFYRKLIEYIEQIQ